MITKTVHEDELIYGMQRELQSYTKKQGMENLPKAGDYLQAAMEIFEGAGLTKQADAVLQILAKIAQEAKPDQQETHVKHKSHDPYTQGLTSEQMENNYKEHGWAFPVHDKNKSDDLLEADVGDDELTVTDQTSMHDFEDEID